MPNHLELYAYQVVLSIFKEDQTKLPAVLPSPSERGVIDISLGNLVFVASPRWHSLSWSSLGCSTASEALQYAYRHLSTSNNDVASRKGFALISIIRVYQDGSRKENLLSCLFWDSKQKRQRYISFLDLTIGDYVALQKTPSIPRCIVDDKIGYVYPKLLEDMERQWIT